MTWLHQTGCSGGVRSLSRSRDFSSRPRGRKPEADYFHFSSVAAAREPAFNRVALLGSFTVQNHDTECLRCFGRRDSQLGQLLRAVVDEKKTDWRTRSMAREPWLRMGMGLQCEPGCPSYHVCVHSSHSWLRLRRAWLTVRITPAGPNDGMLCKTSVGAGSPRAVDRIRIDKRLECP